MEALNKPLKRTRIRDWCAGVLCLLAGSFFVVNTEYQRRYSPTPKDQLVAVSGVAQDVDWLSNHSKSGYHEYVTFSVGGFRLECSNYDPFYPELKRAIQEGKSLEVKVSTNSENLIRFSKLTPLYEVSVDGDRILTYEDTLIRDYSQRAQIGFGIGFVLLFLSAIAFHHSWLNRNLPEI